MPLKTQHDEAPTLNLTSMIDVLFLLIIFFMVATKFDELERNIDIAVPEVSQASDTSPAPQPHVVSVHADGHMELNGISVSEDELTTQLTAKLAAGGISSVVIRGDAQCPFQRVASALSACRAAGISELGITVRIASIGNTKR